MTHGERGKALYSCAGAEGEVQPGQDGVRRQGSAHTP